MNKKLSTNIAKFIRDEFVNNLRKKIKKGYKLANFNLNPFSIVALSSGVFGELTADNIARTLIYPRVLGTSITTSLGNKMQKLCTSYLGARPSAVDGMDFSFQDKVDKKEVYMQLKAGPNTINSPDVKPILADMGVAYRRLNANMVSKMPVFSVGICYGEIHQISAHYKKIQASNVGAQAGVPIFIGQDLWKRITGDQRFYQDLINIFIELFEDENCSDALDAAINDLSKEVKSTLFTKGKFDISKL